MKIGALMPWFGSNRILGVEVGKALKGCVWVGVPFAGGMCELAHIDARTIVANDLHRHVINLARVVKDDKLAPQLYKKLRRFTLFHGDELAESQDICRRLEPNGVPDLELAYHYFITGWMGRSHKAGIDDEFNGGLSIRWNASGGDSAVRYSSAVRSLVSWNRIFRRCTFTAQDGFEFIERCEDSEGHGIYADPPFPGPGDRYRHNCGDTPSEQRQWHARLRDSLARFKLTSVVCRYYDHPLIRELYADWQWRHLEGRTQANAKAAEVLLVNENRTEPSLFS